MGLKFKYEIPTFSLVRPFLKRGEVSRNFRPEAEILEIFSIEVAPKKFPIFLMSINVSHSEPYLVWWWSGMLPLSLFRLLLLVTLHYKQHNVQYWQHCIWKLSHCQNTTHLTSWKYVFIDWRETKSFQISVMLQLSNLEDQKILKHFIALCNKRKPWIRLSSIVRKLILLYGLWAINYCSGVASFSNPP